MGPVAPSPKVDSLPYVVGPPRIEEAPALGALHVAIWREAYAGLMPQRHLDGLDVGARVQRWRAVAEAVDGDGWADGARTLVARYGGRPVGMLVAGAPRDADPPAPVELRVLNVAAEHRGRGAAQALVAAGLPEGPAYLWVLRGNARAIAFYRRLGFALDGVEKDDPVYEVVDQRMTRA